MPITRRIISFFASLDLLILALAYGYFMATDSLPLWFWGLILTFFLARWWARGRFLLLTPATLPIAVLLALIPVTLWASVDWSLSLPKVYGLGLSIAIFFSVLNHIQRRRDIGIVALGLMALGVGFALLGLVGVNWGAGKVVAIPWIYERLPHLVSNVPRSLSGSVSPNGIGGVLVFFVPVLFSFIAFPPALQVYPFSGQRRLFHLSSGWLRFFAILVLLLVLFVLLLTQSRGAVLGLLAGVLLWLIWRDWRWLIVPALGVVALIVIFFTGRLPTLSDALLQMDSVVGNVSKSAAGRFELWQRGMYIIQDFSFTGIGIGTFYKVVNLLYPLFLVGPDSKVPHVHNEILQVAVDMGVPALVAFLALLGSFAFAAWHAYRAIADKTMRALIVGLLCGMAAHQVFGLTDAFLLGTKPAVVMWVYLAIIMALFHDRHSLSHFSSSPDSQLSVPSPISPPSPLPSSPSLPKRLSGILWAFLYWFLLSLLAISFLGDHFFIGLAIAILGGFFVVGYLCLQAFLPATPTNTGEALPRHNENSEVQSVESP